MTTKRRWSLLVAAGAAIVVAVLLVAATRIPFSSDTFRKRVVATLAERLDSEVELQSLTLHFSPRLSAVGQGLTVRYKGRRDVPPLISISSFTVSASLRGLWRRHVDRVILNGLDIQIPPRPDSIDARGAVATASRATGGARQAADGSYEKQVVIDEVEAADAQLTILRRDPTKPMRIWYLHTLKVQTVGFTTRMPYQTLLTNAVPPGQIEATGSFGPWERDDPGATPVDGRFAFDNADLGVFQGISGILASTGVFAGTLDRIEAEGQASVPDFMVNISHHPMALATTYHAVVDGTNGNTTLDPVRATFLGTSIVARGGVHDTEGTPGRTTTLDITMEGGRLEDLMRMAVNTPHPPMAGRLNLVTTFVMPPGPGDVIDKLRLDGRFAIQHGSFTNATVQARVNELSRRASGAPSRAIAGEAVSSDFAGRFRLGQGRLALPLVSFDVPGAVVELAGHYGLRQGTIAFAGNLFMDAKISETVTGFKSILLKLADPIFLQKGRTVVPLKVEGTRDDPKFGLDMRRVFRRGAPRRVPSPQATPPPSPPSVRTTPTAHYGP